MAAGENRFAPELNEKEVIELLKDLSNILGAFFNKTIIPLAPVGYEMIITNLALRAFAIIQLFPEGEVNSGGYIPRREASRYISTALHRP